MAKPQPKKPQGPEYRNLVMRGRTIYYVRQWKGRRIKRSLRTNCWKTASAAARIYEERKGIGRTPFAIIEVPTFAAMAARYLKEDVGHLARTTLADRERILAEDGPIVSFLGERRLDEITPPVLREWYGAEIEGKGRSAGTGGCHLDAIAGVFRLAVNLELIEESPVPRFRDQLRHRSRTQKGRAESDPGRHVHPIEDPKQLAKVVKQARAEDTVAYCLVLLCLDAGLRLGEALGLRWGAIAWGEDEEDATRHLLIDTSRSRGGDPGPTKSGRARRVGLSRRLRCALQELYREGFEPGPEVLVLGPLRPENFRRREWRRILKRAKVGKVRLKDLRDTYASQLLTAGIQLGYVSAQLGHQDFAITARNYAKWCGGDGYRAPLALRPGELPADLLARLAGRRIDPKLTPTVAAGQVTD